MLTLLSHQHSSQDCSLMMIMDYTGLDSSRDDFDWQILAFLKKIETNFNRGKILITQPTILNFPLSDSSRKIVTVVCLAPILYIATG